MLGNCEACGAEFKTFPCLIKKGEGRFCSRACGNPSRGRKAERNGNWRGGRFERSDGYVEVRVGGVYVLEHRAIMAAHVGRDLRTDEHVHHRNGVKSDNRLENLEILSIADHAREHHPGRVESKWCSVACVGCGADLRRLKNGVRRNPNVCCSRSCFAEFMRRKGVAIAAGRARGANGTFV